MDEIFTSEEKKYFAFYALIAVVVAIGWTLIFGPFVGLLIGAVFLFGFMLYYKVTY